MPAIPSEPALTALLGADDDDEHEGSDYGPDGLFRHGPQLAIPPTTRLARLTMARCTESRPSPQAAHDRQRAKQQRALDEIARQRMPKPRKARKPSRGVRFLAAAQGWPVGRNPVSRQAA